MKLNWDEFACVDALVADDVLDQSDIVSQKIFAANFFLNRREVSPSKRCQFFCTYSRFGEKML